MKPKVTVYSDYICPFCLIGKERVDKLEEEFKADVEWKGFEIHPETPREGRTIKDLNMDKGYIEMMRDNVMKLAKEAKVNIKFPSRISNSRLALEISEYAKEKGKFREFHSAIFNAYWQEDRDIGNMMFLFKTAKEVGLDVGELKEYLKDGRARKKLSEYLDEIRRYMITGVPTFIIGDKIIVGAQPYKVLKKTIEEEFAKEGGKSEIT